MKKNIYFYWGNETMSYMRYMTLYSFCLFNPDWKVYLIKNNLPVRNDPRLPQKQDKTEYGGKDYTHLLENLNIEVINFESSMIDLHESVINSMADVHIKDILNWKILSKNAGVVADMDILFIKTITEELDFSSDVGIVCFRGYPEKDYMPVTFMYSSGNNRFFEKVYRKSLKTYDPHSYESCGNLCIEEKNIDEIKGNFPDLKIQRLDDAIVFPFVNYLYYDGISKLYDGDNTNDMVESSVGIHWYGGNVVAQSNNYKINDESVYTIDNTLTVKARGILCQNLNNQS